MSRHWGIVLAALAVALAACSGSDKANPTPPNSSRPSTKPTETTGVAVAQPKRVDENTPCQEIITAADVSAATGAAATLSSSQPFLCRYEVKQAGGTGVLVVSFFGDRTVARTAVETTLSGNPAVEQRTSEGICSFFVVLDSGKQLDAKGAALSVRAELRDLADPCRAARALVERGFSRLPDA